MKNKLIIFSAVALAIILATCVLASGILENSENNIATPEEAINDSIYFVRSDVSTIKMFTPSDKKTVSLTYSESMNVGNDTYQNIYTDPSGDYYHFDANDNMVFFSQSKDFLSSKLDTAMKFVSEDAIVKCAYDHAKTMYGDIVDEFEYTDKRLSSCGNIYYVYFSKNIGKDDFIKKAEIAVHVMRDGDIYGSVLKRYYETIDFDDSLVENLTEETVMKKITAQVKEEYGESFVDCSPQLFDLYYADGAYSIKVPTTITFYTKDGTANMSKTYYYNLD